MSTYRINITVDEDLAYILALMKRVYPTLKETDLIKMATGGYFSLKRKDFEFVEFLDDDASKSLIEAKNEDDDGNIPVFNSSKSMMQFLKQD
jgi:hypothetical protein